MRAPRGSPAPLWLTLGFAVGLLFGWLGFRGEDPGPTAFVAHSVKPPPDARENPVNAGTLRAVEQTFARWGGYAVWENDLTEIAAWDARRKRHSDFYEVRRHDGKFYFRSLGALTRPIIDHGVSATLTVAFTEPQAMRDQFYRENPGYDPATAPRGDVPPLPPERYPASPPRNLTDSDSATTLEAKTTERTTNAPSLTPGAGG